MIPANPLGWLNFLPGRGIEAMLMVFVFVPLAEVCMGIVVAEDGAISWTFYASVIAIPDGSNLSPLITLENLINIYE